jgi:prephenate dehydrogenase
MLAEVDLVVLAAPVLTNIERLAELPDALDGSAVVTDVGSTKRAMLDAARRLPDRLAFIGGHPLAGAARAGISFASPDLFRHRPWVLTPGAETRDADLARLEQFIGALGARPMAMTPDEHDRVLSWVSHLPQLVASSLMRVVGDAVGSAGLELAGRGLRDTTRLASSPPHVWIDICRTNGDLIRAALDRVIGELQELRSGIADPDVVASVFDAAARWRDALTEKAPDR